MKISLFHTYKPLLLGALIGAAIGGALGYFGECTSGTCPFTSTWWRGALYGGILGLIYGVALKAKKQASEKLGRSYDAKSDPTQRVETRVPPDTGK